FVGIVHDRASPHGEPKPAVLSVAQVGWDIGLQLWGIDGGEQPGLGGIPQVASVHRQQHIGRRLVALGLEPLEEFRGTAVKDFNNNASLFGKGVEDWLLTVVPCRVDHYLLGGCGWACAQHDANAQSCYDRQYENGPRLQPASCAHRPVSSKIL